MRVLRTDDTLLVDTEPIGHPILWKTVQTYSLGRQVTSADLTPTLTVLSVIGPAARRAVDEPAARGGARARRPGRSAGS